MFNQPDKKIPILTFIIFFGLLLYCQLAKEYELDAETYFYAEKGIEIPISHYFIDILGVHISYLKISFVSMVFLCVSIYWYKQKDDIEIKEMFSKVFMFLKNSVVKPISSIVDRIYSTESFNNNLKP